MGGVGGAQGDEGGGEEKKGLCGVLLTQREAEIVRGRCVRANVYMRESYKKTSFSKLFLRVLDYYGTTKKTPPHLPCVCVALKAALRGGMAMSAQCAAISSTPFYSNRVLCGIVFCMIFLTTK